MSHWNIIIVSLDNNCENFFLFKSSLNESFLRNPDSEVESYRGRFWKAEYKH